MTKQFFITEFWTGPDGHRQLWHSQITETDPTQAIRAVPPETCAVLTPPDLLIITFPVPCWANPCTPPKNKL